MNITIENIHNYKIAYIRQVGPYGENNNKIMEKLKSWAKDNDLFNDKSIIFGIAHDNPEITNPEDCRYDTCLVVSDYLCIDDESINEGTIVGGKYAVFKIQHTAEAVKKAWENIFIKLQELDYQFDKTRPIMERYIVEMVNNHFCEICVPIK